MPWRVAQWRAGKEGRMSERSEFCAPPARREQRSVPEASAKGQGIRLAFLLVPFLWRSKEKELARRGETRPVSASPSGRNPTWKVQPQRTRTSTCRVSIIEDRASGSSAIIIIIIITTHSRTTVSPASHAAAHRQYKPRHRACAPHAGFQTPCGPGIPWCGGGPRAGS